MLKNSVISAYFSKEIIPEKLIVLDTIDEAIDQMQFNGTHPVNETGNDETIYHIKSINAFVFSYHLYLFPLFRFMQHSGILPRKNNALINWDAHSDFYVSPIFNDIQKFSSWGKPQNVDWSINAFEFSKNTFDHTKKRVSIASFIYPLLWDKSITHYTWRDFLSQDISNRILSKLLNKKSGTECLQFLYSKLGDHFYTNLDKESTYVTPDPKIEINIEHFNASHATQNEFNLNIDAQAEQPSAMTHSIDIDVFFNGSPHKPFSNKRFNGFLQDLNFIAQNPKLLPSAIFIATSPNFSNPTQTKEATLKTL